ncbi:hypothetical protein XELAEV_18014829mg [Xenopus laevis]|uniref:UDENN domain-containing protein n=1 Tax=Xenopus laevis TaxID=8355 RepID=A0A974HVD1_XENLA|nr:hypothetical protein XELAEV_18014829mg [Xenopus laevis]
MDHLAGVIRRSFRRKSNKGGNTNGNPASEDSSIPDDCKTLVMSGGQSFFEYLVVVSLKKNCDGCYAPQITYQFPKMNLQRENILNFRKDEEERLLNAIPLFCFPDGNNWAPLREYKSETFSFVLTNIDSSRKFGYCRRLLQPNLKNNGKVTRYTFSYIEKEKRQTVRKHFSPKPAGNGSRSPEVYCIISSLGCFGLFSKILDEVEKRRAISTALVYPFMQGLREATFPAPGKTVKIKSFIPESGTEMIELTRPLDCRLEHIDFNTLMQCLKSQIILVIFASVVLERRIVFVASDLRILSECIHAVVALLYPFAWEHTYIPVLPHVLIDTVSCPAPFIVGVQNQFLSSILDQPMEEVSVSDWGAQGPLAPTFVRMRKHCMLQDFFSPLSEVTAWVPFVRETVVGADLGWRAWGPPVFFPQPVIHFKKGGNPNRSSRQPSSGSSCLLPMILQFRLLRHMRSCHKPGKLLQLRMRCFAGLRLLKTRKMAALNCHLLRRWRNYRGCKWCDCTGACQKFGRAQIRTWAAHRCPFVPDVMPEQPAEEQGVGAVGTTVLLVDLCEGKLIQKPRMQNMRSSMPPSGFLWSTGNVQLPSAPALARREGGSAGSRTAGPRGSQKGSLALIEAAKRPKARKEAKGN